ncbi:uncharacterized protein LOC128863181 [Anastrepha ludens]|uniref:uncharacterized protein LOC128863181 n=1 Tax=Anastrepha ludens TaxID=28586 RepID=UPI0023B1A9B2|nr:uncharacterized protein LOC128863181 [Anastrepha ludens]
MSKTISLLLCATLFQLGFCLPRTQTLSSSEVVNKEYKAIAQEKDVAARVAKPLPVSSEREKLAAMIKEGTTKHLKFLLQGSNKIAKDLLADPIFNSVDTEAMRTERAVVEKYVRDSDEALRAQSGKIIEPVLKDFFTFTNRHKLKNESHTTENDVVANALKAHGFEGFNEEEMQLLKEIGNHYADEFEKYLNSLSPADREKEKDLVYVYETYMENKWMDRSHYGFRYKLYFVDTDESDQ